ncbi:hypothetical protein JTE90_014581 [Oedothorax gibbosus]|uniref:HTH OST-type domain-containing protein n=1 Tax=Oedothorax gibbosus TaxID=931172 RepID=A0AAV6ULI6_9ARAC|nr:hypothetical protein JTE90_014581 [Oedothorax gibbosus]
MNKEALKKSVAVNLRCVTQSSKGGVNLNSLQSDYKGLIGQPIPFLELGHPSLESFLQSIPDVVCLKKSKNGLCMVEAVADSSTAHIAKLISQQKNTKSAKKGNSKKPSKPIRKYHESWRSPSTNPEGISKVVAASTSNSSNVKVPLPKPKNTGVGTSAPIKQKNTSKNNVISQPSNVAKSTPSVSALKSNITGVTNLANKSNGKSEQSTITSSNPLRPILKSNIVTSSPINPISMKPVKITKTNPLGEGTSNSTMSYSSLFTDTSTLKESTTPSSILMKQIKKHQNSTTSNEIAAKLNSFDAAMSDIKNTIHQLTQRLGNLCDVGLSTKKRNRLRQRINQADNLLRASVIAMKEQEVLLNGNQVEDSCTNLVVVALIINNFLLFDSCNFNLLINYIYHFLLNNLQRDYQNLFGIPVPYKELNYTSLEAFVRDLPDVINLKMDKYGQIYLQAVSDAETTDNSSDFFNQCDVELIPPPVAPTTVLPSFHQREPSPSASSFPITTVTNAAYKPSLKCFPKIKYNIASAKLSSLLTMNLLLFADDSYVETLKRGVLSFDGFGFCEGSDKWKEREILFSMLSEDVLKECSKLLCIDCNSNNKKYLVNKLLQFLASPGSANNNVNKKISEEDFRKENIRINNEASSSSSDCCALNSIQQIQEYIHDDQRRAAVETYLKNILTPKPKETKIVFFNVQNAYFFKLLGMEKPELKDSVCCNLRSVTQSIKGGVPLNRLERDYRDLIGSAIPYRELGYNSLESFIRAIPTVISLTKGRDGYLMAEAVADSSTAHIASLISRQKVTSKAKATKRFSSRRGGKREAYGEAYKGERNSYGSYSAAKSSGRSYKHDYKASRYHSRPQNKTSPLNFKIEIKNTNFIPADKTPALTTTKPLPAPSTSRLPQLPSPPAADKPKSKAPFMMKGYEIAPRFQRLLQRKVEAREQERRCSQESSSSSNSHTARSSVTPPRTPSPNPYAFTASSIASAHSSSSRTSPTDDIFFPPPSEPLAPPQMSYSPVKVGSNGFASARPRSPLQLRARLNTKTLSQQLELAQSAKEYVEIYARINNLACKYSTNTIGQKKPNKGYVTVLILGDHKHLSYPEVAKSMLEAEEIAAEKAVNKIKESLVLPETSISNAEEIQIFLNRIEEVFYVIFVLLNIFFA